MLSGLTIHTSVERGLILINVIGCAVQAALFAQALKTTCCADIILEISSDAAGTSCNTFIPDCTSCYHGFLYGIGLCICSCQMRYCCRACRWAVLQPLAVWQLPPAGDVGGVMAGSAGCVTGRDALGVEAGQSRAEVANSSCGRWLHGMLRSALFGSCLLCHAPPLQNGPRCNFCRSHKDQ